MLYLLNPFSPQPYLESDGWLNIELHHALDRHNPDKFTFRGNVSIPSLNIGIANVLQEPLNSEDREKLKVSHQHLLRIHNNSKSARQDLAEHNQFYRLKSYVTFSDATKIDYLTSTKACALANAQLADLLWVSIDTSGSVLAITQTVSGSGNCQDLQVSSEDLENFNTHVIVKQMELAPVPDTTSFIQKLEREREARERGEVKDNRGFFAKYVS